MRTRTGVGVCLVAIGALCGCSATEPPTPLGPFEVQWGAEPRDDGWRPAAALPDAPAGSALWFRVEVPTTSGPDAALHVRALFADDAWVCGRHFPLTGRLPILPVPCSPTQLLLRANPDARFGTIAVALGSAQQLWARLLQRDLATFTIGATMALVGLLLLAAGLRAGAERAYRGLGLFLGALGVLVLLGTQLRHVFPVSGTTLFYAHEVATALYPVGFADFLLGTFGDGPRRVLRRGLSLFAVYVVVEWALHVAGVVHLITGRAPTVVFIVVFLVQGLALAFRTRTTNPSANIFLFGIAALFALSVPDILDGAGFKVLEFQTVPYAVLSFGVAMVVMVERQHRRAREDAQASARELAAKLAALEERTKEVNALNQELRHQIAERSRELAVALQGGRAGVREARALVEGDVLDGRYRVAKALGRGAMGTVYAVERLSDGRRFALKVMSGAVDAQAAARFAREAEIAARVEDEHLVTVVDVGGASSGQLYLVMEFVDGRPLEEHRARFGDIPWALGLLPQLARGVRALHAAGVVHRDLKPGNVLLTTTPDGRQLAKISDFGISRREPVAEAMPEATPLVSTLVAEPKASPAPSHVSTIRGHEDTLASGRVATVSEPLEATHRPAPRGLPEGALTIAGALLGTPAYMAPELCGGAQHASPASDLFAFGLIAYELLTGRRAFEEPPLVTSFAGRRLAPVAPLPDAVPRPVADLVMRCLSEAPLQRPSAETLAAALG